MLIRNRTILTQFIAIMIGPALLGCASDSPTNSDPPPSRASAEENADSQQSSAPKNDLLQPTAFVRIPGPNPILTPGAPGEWDGHIIEMSDAFKDKGTYYLYYHGSGGGKGYQIGVATSQHPLGPFVKYEGNPLLKVGPEGGWKDEHIACAFVLKEATDRYYMWFSTKSSKLNADRRQHHSVFSVGLATADNPLGPWKEHEGNPIMENFGYVGGVVKVGSKYFLYTEHPIGSSGDDYGPMSVATADHPEGPWTPYPGNPVMGKGEWGEWDDGGISEAEVLYHSGVFHLFYGGTKLYEPRIASRESIGYAWSLDGFTWQRYGRNPVAPRHQEPNAASYSEVHSIIEPPFIYLYHTLRYVEPWRDRFRSQFPTVEDLGVQILAMQRPFKLDMPVLTIDELSPGGTTSLIDCPHMSLDAVNSATLTVRCTYGADASGGIRLNVYSSRDGKVYDREPFATFDLEYLAGKIAQKSFNLRTEPRFIKVIVENQDDAASVTDIDVVATLGG